MSSIFTHVVTFCWSEKSTAQISNLANLTEESEHLSSIPAHMAIVG